MNSTFKKMLLAIERWPEASREALAEAAREIEAARTGLYALSPDEEAAIAEGLTQAESGEFATGSGACRSRLGDLCRLPV